MANIKTERSLLVAQRLYTDYVHNTDDTFKFIAELLRSAGVRGDALLDIMAEVESYGTMSGYKARALKLVESHPDFDGDYTFNS
jgi:hypothetical protein